MQTVSFKLTDNVDLVKRSTQASINAALEGIGQHIEGEAIEELNIPFPHANGENRPYEDTGTLKQSITHQVNQSENAVYIGTNVNYAV
jgi:phage gpG-like protein